MKIGWDNHQIGGATVIFDGINYVMFYHAGHPQVNGIGVAISTDRIVWNEREQIFDRNNNPWDCGRGLWIGGSSVIYEDGIYKMWYAGRESTDPLIIRIGYTHSINYLEWSDTVDALLPIEGEPPYNSWEYKFVFSPAIIKVGNQYKMWYGGGGSGSVKLGLATRTTSILCSVSINPETLNLKSNGQWITTYITLPEVYSVLDIDPSTIEMEGISAEWFEIQDSVFMAKFDRATIQTTLTNEPDYESAPKSYDLTLTITGTLYDGTPFEGSDTIIVLKK